MSLIIDGTSGVTFNDSSLQGAAASPYVLKNRLINGAMVIDQRNAGASLTPAGSGVYTYSVDRWSLYNSTASAKFTAQQNAGSVTPPTGFSNYLGITSSSAYAIASGDLFLLQQKIEGFNCSDLAWGTSSAKTVTLSFWVYSSLTGTFGGAVISSAGTVSYPFSYTISSANTWTQISITISGPTSGTWGTGNASCIQLCFSLGTGSSNLGTAGSWTYSTQYFGATGQVNVVSTNAATWYITGVQLEQNTSATPFERRLYNQELANCQRYYYLHASGNGYAIGNGNNYTATQLNCVVQFPVTMRTIPTLNATSGTDYYAFARNGASDTFNSFTIFAANTNAAGIYNTTEISGTAGQAGWILTNNASSSLAFQAEL
jgi:hypothetical protein